MDDLVEVLDITLTTDVPGLTIVHTVRQHEGDELVEDGSGHFKIQFGPRKKQMGNEERELPGKRVRLFGPHIVQLEIDVRLEPRVRPTTKDLLDMKAAEVNRLKKKHGVVTTDDNNKRP